MPQRHTVYCKRSLDTVTAGVMLKHLEPLDFQTLGEDYGLSEAAVDAALPLLIKSVDRARFHLLYGKSAKRPVEIERWESEEQHRAAVEETIDNLTIQDRRRAERIGEWLRASADSVSIAFGIDPPAAMFAWEVVRFFASGFEGMIETDDGKWLRIDADYQPAPV